MGTVILGLGKRRECCPRAELMLALVNERELDLIPTREPLASLKVLLNIWLESAAKIRSAPVRHRRCCLNIGYATENPLSVGP